MKPNAEPDPNTGTVATSSRLWPRLLRVWPYFGRLRGTWALVGLAAVVGAATEPAIPALLKPLLDRGFQRGELELWTVPAALLLLFAVRGMAGYVAQLGLTRITNDGMARMRQEMFDTLMKGQLQLFSQSNSSAISNTLVYEVQNGSAMLVNSVLSLTRNGLTLLALTSYLFYLNWKLTLIVAAIFPGVAFVMRTLTRRLHKLTRSAQLATDDLAYVVEENVLAHKDIRLYNAQASQTARFSQLNDTLRGLAFKSTVAGAAMTPLTQMLAAVALSAVISVALVQSSQSGTSVGGFVAFVTAMLMIIAPIRQLSEISSPITRGLAALERGIELIENTPAETEGSYARVRADGAIDFQDVSVRYPQQSQNALQSLNLSVRPGEVLALVGASGSGKTTLVNLLPRFVDLAGGQILLDGHDIREWQLKSLRAQFAFVSQHVVMVNDSIAANVALGLEVDRARVQRCLESANLGALLRELPQGLDTLVGHNAMQMSGGQRQRLAIARALYKDAPILVLDEATSALDAESERAVQEALQDLMRGRTTLIIAHRLTTVRHADRIVVMEGGRIVEVGTHAVLANGQGLYAKLNQIGLETATAPTSSAEV